MKMVVVAAAAAAAAAVISYRTLFALQAASTYRRHCILNKTKTMKHTQPR